MLIKTAIFGLFFIAIIGCNQQPPAQNINIEIPPQKQVQPNPPQVQPPIIIPPQPPRPPIVPPPHHPPHKKDL